MKEEDIRDYLENHLGFQQEYTTENNDRMVWISDVTEVVHALINEMSKPHSKSDLLILAGRMANAAERVIQSDTKNLSYNIESLRAAVVEYDRAIIANANNEE